MRAVVDCGGCEMDRVSDPQSYTQSRKRETRTHSQVYTIVRFVGETQHDAGEGGYTIYLLNR